MSVVMLTAPGPDISARIEAGQPVLQESKSSGYLVSVPGQRGNIHARMGGTVEVRSDAGQMVEQFPLTAGRGFLLPEQERLFESRGNGQPPRRSLQRARAAQPRRRRRPDAEGLPLLRRGR